MASGSGPGVPLPDGGGRDYFGNPVPGPPAVGAHQGEPRRDRADKRG